MAAGGFKPEGGTSERMHRIARYHVISVIKGKTADEIINEHLKSRAKVQRPQGYVAPDEFVNSNIKVRNVFIIGLFNVKSLSVLVVHFTTVSVA